MREEYEQTHHEEYPDKGERDRGEEGAAHLGAACGEAARGAPEFQARSARTFVGRIRLDRFSPLWRGARREARRVRGGAQQPLHHVEHVALARGAIFGRAHKPLEQLA